MSTGLLAGTARLLGARRRGLSDRRLALGLLLPTAVVLVVFELVPLFMALRDSLFAFDQQGETLGFVGLQNFVTTLSDPEIRFSFVRSLIYVAGAVALQTAAGLGIALLLNQALPARSIWRGLVLFPYVIPAVVATLLFRFMFNGTYGAINYLLVSSGVAHGPVNFLGDPHLVMVVLILITSWRHTPFMTIALLARLQTVPKDVVEAARVDGARRWSVFRHVALPWLMPVIVILMLLRTMWTGTEFDTPYLTAFGGPLNASTVVPVQIYSLYVEQQRVGPAAAVAVCVAIVLLLLSVLYLRGYRQAERQID